MMGRHQADGEHLKEVHPILWTILKVPRGLVRHHIREIRPPVTVVVGIAQMHMEPIVLVIAVNHKGMTTDVAVSRN